MSIDYSTYVGPYVRCVVQRMTVTEERTACTNPTCENHHRDTWASDIGFCHRCGSPLGPVPFAEERDAVDHWDVSEAINERLTTADGDAYMEWSQENGAHLWKPNTGNIGRHLDSRESFYLAEITPAELMREVAQFTQHFAADLDVLRERYGTEAVAIQWGIIQDYS